MSDRDRLVEIMKNKKKVVDKQSRLGYNSSMDKKLSEYFREIGRKGGKVRSERKSHACRENGKLGGRKSERRKAE